MICEPTNACNLGCVFCGNRNMVRPWTYMPLPMYEQLLEQMQALDIKRLTLHTIGEPTMHKQLVQMIHMAKEVGMVVTLSTNGTLLDESLARELVAAAPDILNYRHGCGRRRDVQGDYARASTPKRSTKTSRPCTASGKRKAVSSTARGAR
ncbi:MAG: radical SAM protein [Planctomycetota bacterium]